jgi:lipoyl synthase
MAGPNRTAKPPWLRVRLPAGEGYRKVRQILEDGGLHTVCQSAHCPNQGECWQHGTATFMILGDRCTRDCRFCAVTSQPPEAPDPDEPARVAEAARRMDLKHVVITSVTRDDLPDGGAALWAETVRQVASALPNATVEALIPDFQGDTQPLAVVLAAKPTVLNHNLETVPRLYPTVRPQADYARSIELLERARQAGATTKTGLMLGLGETDDEVDGVLRDCREVDVQIVTLGQYLQPSAEHLPVAEFVTPEKFDAWRDRALALGFAHVESAPLVRSSYHAERAVQH